MRFGCGTVLAVLAYPRVMSELGDLLELLHGAGGSFQTLASRWRCWRHDERAHAAFMAAHAGSGSVVSVYGEGPSQPPEHEEEVRLWVARPDRMREEHDDSTRGQATLAVQVGSTWWAYSPRMGAMTNDGDEHHQHGIGQMFQAHLDPARVMGLFDIEITGRGERAGHPVICATWRSRALTDHEQFALHQMGSGAQEHAIEVDADRGVLLRLEARFAGEPMAISQALDVTFDAKLDPALFRFVAPGGEQPQAAHSLHRFHTGVALHEAAAMVPFTVYALGHVPVGWELTVSVHLGSQRPPVPAAVHLNYRSDDATAAVNIGLGPAETHDGWRLDEAEEITRGDQTLRIRRRTDMWPQAQLSTVLGNTTVTMNSDNLSADDLIELADRLVPASDGPPSL
ncbi:MAG: hypothetical protein QOK16_1801 [Solirubrobacteraceae bacterium]|nr:hypothetical protein [Solirubrobacteraceae bacterium]